MILKEIKIDDSWFDVDNVDSGRYCILPMLRTGRMEFYVAENSEEAGKKAREHYEDMAENDPKEFACLVGEETLIQWGMGHWAGPGSTQVKSLQEWLDLWLDTPEEFFASYDGVESSINGFRFENENDEPREDGSKAVYELIDPDTDSVTIDGKLEGVDADPDSPDRDEELIDMCKNGIEDAFGFIPTVAYRHN